MVMSHSLTYVIELVDYLNLFVEKVEVMIVVVDASYLLLVDPFGMDDDPMEVAPAAAVAAALDNNLFVEQLDLVVQMNNYCKSVFDDNNVHSSNYLLDDVGYVLVLIADTSSWNWMDPCVTMKDWSKMDGKYSSLVIEIHWEEMYCYYRSYPLKDNQKIEKYLMKAVLVFVGLEDVEAEVEMEEEQAFVDRKNCSLDDREMTSANP